MNTYVVKTEKLADSVGGGGAGLPVPDAPSQSVPMKGPVAPFRMMLN
jgi:hypothetical protein